MSILTGKKAPKFKSPAIINGKELVKDFSLDQFLEKKYVLFFFYTKNFSSICPNELFAFQNEINEFKRRNVELVACSTDSEESHLAWLNLEKKNGGIKGITYTLVSDTTKIISHNFGVLLGKYKIDDENKLTASGPMIPLRGAFLIDKNGLIQYQTVNFFTLQRNVKEVLRMIDALQSFEKTGKVCPAN